VPSASGKVTDSHDVLLHRLILRLALQLVPRLPPDRHRARWYESVAMKKMKMVQHSHTDAPNQLTHLAFPLGSNMPGLPAQ
jgi:hypothetical protein